MALARAVPWRRVPALRRPQARQVGFHAPRSQDQDLVALSHSARDEQILERLPFPVDPPIEPVAEPWENLPPSKQEAHDSHPSRKLYATTVWIDRDLLDAWDDQIAELRSQQFLRAMTALERENIARKAQGLRPLRKLLPRHFDNGEETED